MSPDFDEYASKLASNSNIRLFRSRSNVTNDALVAPQNSLLQEKTWQDCLMKIVFEIFKHGSQQRVINSSPYIRPGVITSCDSEFDPDMQGNITIKTGRAVDGMVWDQLAVAAQVLSIAAATSNDLDNLPAARVQSGTGEVFAEIKIGYKWRVASGGNAADDSTATA